jgi:hypothetical protein
MKVVDASTAIDYYNFNTTKGPTKDVRVRKALNMSLDKQALADWRHVRPLMAFIRRNFSRLSSAAGDL